MTEYSFDLTFLHFDQVEEGGPVMNLDWDPLIEKYPSIKWYAHDTGFSPNPAQFSDDNTGYLCKDLNEMQLFFNDILASNLDIFVKFISRTMPIPGTQDSNERIFSVRRPYREGVRLTDQEKEVRDVCIQIFDKYRTRFPIVQTQEL